MATYEDLLKANQTITTTPIKGKDYASVAQRTKAFRMVYPEGCIITDMTSNEGGVCVFTASVYADENHILSTGTAYEKENSSYINKTSYIENCETSAVGRALGFAGFGIDVEIASSDEMTNAISNQPAESKYIKALRADITELNVNESKLCEQYSVEQLEDITEAQCFELMHKLEKEKEKRAKS